MSEGLDQKKIYLINAARSFSGIGRYAKDTFEAISGNKELVSMALSREDYEAGLPGIVYKGIFPPLTSGWFLNTSFEHLVFKKVRDHLKGPECYSCLVHYVDPYILPFSEVKKSLVSILDVIPLSNEV
jgi:hypothetical protein